jgi:hypothetical protein
MIPAVSGRLGDRLGSIGTKRTSQVQRSRERANYLSDGSVATTFDHCGDADLCATIDYKNGEKLSIYSEGAAYCQPYMLHFVTVRGVSTLRIHAYAESRRGHLERVWRTLRK